MRFVADFHIHSPYSRATSPQMTLENLDKMAKVKGIKVMGTGDFTHPAWFANLKEKLVPTEPGLFKLRKNDQGTRFILTSEISCIYSKGGKVRKVHTLIFSPTFEAVEQINTQLGLIGNLKADGRPILGLDVKELAKIALSASEDCMIIGAHIWTPWFSLFGSKSGFDAIEECFEDYSKHIYVVETGLSSNPAMNWRLSALDNIALISNSDAHSLPKIGREANIFNTELSYFAIEEALKTKDPKKFLSTIEFFPEEGRYHYDGHRACNISLSPIETQKIGDLCPNCGRPLTLGTLNRVNKLADRPEGFRPENAIGFKSLIPLQEIIAEVLGVGVGTKKVAGYYDPIVDQLGSELDILLNVPLGDLKQTTLPEIAQAICLVREGKVNLEPGYDGVYGKISILGNKPKRNTPSQKQLL